MRAICRSTRRRTASTSIAGERARPRAAAAAAAAGSLKSRSSPQSPSARTSRSRSRRGALARGGKLRHQLGSRRPACAPGRACSSRRSRRGAWQAAPRSRPVSRACARNADQRARRDRAVEGAARLGRDPQGLDARPAAAPGGSGRPRSRRAPAASRARECCRRCGSRSRARRAPAMRSSEKVGLGGRLACTIAASDKPERVVGRLQARDC